MLGLESWCLLCRTFVGPCFRLTDHPARSIWLGAQRTQPLVKMGPGGPVVILGNALNAPETQTDVDVRANASLHERVRGAEDHDEAAVRSRCGTGPARRSRSTSAARRCLKGRRVGRGFRSALQHRLPRRSNRFGDWRERRIHRVTVIQPFAYRRRQLRCWRSGVNRPPRAGAVPCPGCPPRRPPPARHACDGS